MLLFFALQFAAASQNIKAASLLREATTIPKDLFYLAARPSGTMFCNKKLKERQNRAFDKRFGKRFNRLVVAVTSREGLSWSSDDVVLTPCYLYSQNQAVGMLDDFEGELSAYERRFGLSPNVR